MAEQVRGVVARAKGAPVTLETILVPDPGPGEAMVRVQACGVCHTDLHYREGGINDDFPFLLGHEAAGIVESVGDGVTDVAPGDFVILNWRAVCGECRACRRGRPWYCFSTHNATQKMTLEDGTELSPALGIGAFAEKTLVAAGQCTKVDPAAPPQVAGLLGCGVMAGLGAAINTGGVGRGDTVAVIGCGGVGDAAIAGARLAGARTIIAVDVDDRKLEWAKELRRHAHGQLDATTDPVEAIRAAHRRVRRRRRDRRGRPAGDVRAGLLRPRPRRHRRAGRRAHPDMTLELPLIDVFGRGGVAQVAAGTATACPAATSRCSIDLYLQGRLPLDRFVSETIGLGRRRGGVRQDAPRRRAALGGGLRRWSPGSSGWSPAAPSPSTAARGTSTTTSGWSATTTRWSSSTPRTTPRRSSPPSTAGRCWRSCARTGTTTTSARPGSSRTATGAPVLLHPDDRMLWDVVHPDRTPSQLADGDVRRGGRGRRRTCCTPPATPPAAVCLYVPALGAVLSGDTLFHGGPGATGRSFSDFATILGSIRSGC